MELVSQRISQLGIMEQGKVKRTKNIMKGV